MMRELESKSVPIGNGCWRNEDNGVRKEDQKERKGKKERSHTQRRGISNLAMVKFCIRLLVFKKWVCVPLITIHKYLIPEKINKKKKSFFLLWRISFVVGLYTFTFFLSFPFSFFYFFILIFFSFF